MSLSENRAIGKIVVLLVLLSILGVFVFFIVRGIFSTPSNADLKRAGFNYSRMICNEAVEQHYEKLNPSCIEVTLQEHCFSGFIGLPNRWQTWQIQMQGNRPNDWAAEWYSGWATPSGPFTKSEFDSGPINVGVIPSHQVRFEGKGTLRLYRQTGDIISTPSVSCKPISDERTGRESSDQPTPTNPVEAKVYPPILPRSGSNDRYRFFLEYCARSGESITCHGYMTNLTDASTQAGLTRASMTDDEGFSFQADNYRFDGSFPGKLPQGVKTRFSVSFTDPHMNAKTITPQLSVYFEPAHDDYVFPEIPIGK